MLQSGVILLSALGKLRLTEYIKEVLDIYVSPESLFDVQVKRIHEYKRQFMNILG